MPFGLTKFLKRCPADHSSKVAIRGFSLISRRHTAGFYEVSDLHLRLDNFNPAIDI